MSQVMLIGVGGLDADLLRVYGPSLPHLRRLMLESPFLDLQSTIPPEPAPAWVSVYTGLNPANHGLLEKMDCLERTLSESEPLQEETFWERAAQAGKRVCVLNPLLTGQSPTSQDLFISQSLPASASHGSATKSTFPALLDEPLIPPASQLASFCNSLRERTEQQIEVALELFNRESWDLFFVQLDALDHVQHFLWRYSDPGDPMYPGKNAHASRILDFYRLFDEIVGRFHAVLPAECVLAVVSSHGHERRCVYRLHINEWLREQNFLITQGKAKSLSRYASSGKKQNAAVEAPEKGRLDTFFSLLARYLPWRHSHHGVSHSIDHEHSIAHLSELAHATSSYGGISLNRAQIEREQLDYEQVRDAILSGLAQLRFKDSRVVNWVKRREQCYQGKRLDCYPDILFELRNDFGVGRSIHAPLIIPDSMHRLISGTHSSHGVFLFENWPDELEAYEDFQIPSVMDVAPTLLRLLDIECPSLDGQALIHQRSVRQLI